ncbi:dGTPase [Burkholderia vietnamiensis]|uniref:Putative deoxyguanosinetriphosphate triphosphohydrolase n=1 Tax=Burkholderia vietnamiensis (strain G4 / LMG 22486) TaxID=269482 RepID=A4JAH3_BURVG|nr:putative deoxyguanosinetriphosphate triphosphohydrolase [Burkholderia vietnamiensis G4]MCB4346311.1 dGTPase [Burkholderia vietnamiensis]
MSTISNYLTTTRLRRSEVQGRTIVTESESDRGRILFCPAFRRLQQKAQVFSMEPNAAVRSRLTHSLEVSQLGRFIADEICGRMADKLDPLERTAFGNFVEAACLLHDIGNPPFGHFGEAAIQKWFSENGHDLIKKAVELKHGDIGTTDPRLVNALADFKEFDGNPQGLRVVARLQWNTDEFGLNLTKTTLASFLKYIRCAGDKSSGNFTKKAGYFSTEVSIVNSVWSEFNYSKPQRFPLAYVMEAADDIAYCISDLEDSIEKGVVSEDSALEEIEKRFLKCEIPNTDSALAEIKSAITAMRSHKRTDGKEFTYTDFRTTLNRIIVAYVADRYVEFENALLKGELDSLLPRTSAAGAILETLKEYCRDYVYIHDSVQRTELAGYTAIRGLLDHYATLLCLSREAFSAALRNERKDAFGNSIMIESKLLSGGVNNQVQHP